MQKAARKREKNAKSFYFLKNDDKVIIKVKMALPFSISRPVSQGIQTLQQRGAERIFIFTNYQLGTTTLIDNVLRPAHPSLPVYDDKTYTNMHALCPFTDTADDWVNELPPGIYVLDNYDLPRQYILKPGDKLYFANPFGWNFIKNRHIYPLGLWPNPPPWHFVELGLASIPDASRPIRIVANC